MSSYIPNLLRSQVIERANNRCEYCCLSQVGQEATFHIDHVKPIKNGGKTTIDNLALACVSCSLHKSARELAPDPESKKTVPIFNPRQQEWSEHFQWAGFHLRGQTPTGRATVFALKQNRPLILAIREEEELLGRHP
ncbi:MAG: HNH endonuclease signature motif containing protein [Ardenticatenaceae bacterium]|nr:HNH endonuclease signature motif containing protein [Ardenticatenaceae bacterium]